MARPAVVVFVTLLSIVGFFAGLNGQSIMFFTCLLGLVFVGLAYLWNAWVFRRLTVNRRLSHSKAEYGQRLFYQVELINRKFLPIFWLTVEDSLPDGISFVHDKVVSKSLIGHTRSFKDLFSLKWYQWAKRSYQITADSRGYYLFQRGSLHYADLFGLFEKRSVGNLGEAELIVYPQIFPLAQLGISHSELFGSRSSQGWLFTDPLNLVGTRAYSSRDSMRDINWKASARHLTLQSETYQPSLEKEIHIFLDFPPQARWWEQALSSCLEWGISVAASLIDHYCKAGYRISFYSNVITKVKRNSHFTVVKPGFNNQREQLLTALALLHDLSIRSSSELIRTQFISIQPGATVLLITPSVSDGLSKELYRLNQSCRLTVLQVADSLQEKDLPGIKRMLVKEGENVHEAS